MPVKDIKSRDRKVRKITGRVDVSGGTPSVGVGSGYTVTDTAAGKVKITLTKPGKSILGAIATAINSTDTLEHHVKVLAKTEASDVTFGIFAGDGTDGVLADNIGFYFEITVKDVSN